MITERDIAVLLALVRYYVLSRVQIQRLCFPTDAAGPRHASPPPGAARSGLSEPHADAGREPEFGRTFRRSTSPHTRAVTSSPSTVTTSGSSSRPRRRRRTITCSTGLP